MLKALRDISWSKVMKAALSACMIVSCSYAQYAPCAMNMGLAGTVPGDGLPHCFTLNVSGFPVPLPPYGTPGQCCLEGIGVSISSVCSGDLTITATSPAGTTLILADHKGGSTSNAFGSYGGTGCVSGGTTFSTYGTGSLNGTPPFITCAPGQGPYYVPDGPPLNGTDVFTGENINGTWNICVTVDNPSACGGGTNNSVNVAMVGVYGNAASAITSVTAVNPVLCNGDSTALNASSWGGVSYAWSPATGLDNTTNVSVTASPNITTTYTVTATAGNGSTSTASVTITVNYPAVSNIATTNAMCGINNGTAIASPSGSPGPYSYLWNSIPLQTGPSATGLSPGAYSCAITDGNGCTSYDTLNILQDSSLMLLASSTSTYCNNATGMCNINASGGTGLYTYSWNTNPVQTNATATGLGMGTYTCTVIDISGCSGTATGQVSYFNSGSVSISSVVHVSCNGTDDGSAVAIIQGGAPPYAYSWNTVPQQTTMSASALPPGSWQVTITDAAGCSATSTVLINEPTQLNSTVNVVNSSCAIPTGEASVLVTGGTPAYLYMWNTSPAQQTPTATGLNAGTYNCRITDLNGCTKNASAVIATGSGGVVSVASLNHVLCNGTATGSVSVTVTGGMPPFTYLWNTNPVQTSSLISNLTVGSYVATVTDAGGCSGSVTVTINEPAPLTANTTFTNNYCGAITALAAVVPGGGTGPYVYSWSTVPVQTTHLATGLNSGSYTCVVIDANGCTLERSFLITDVNSGSAYTSVVQQVNCNGNSSGSVGATITGGVPPYTYHWSTQPVQTTVIATGLTAGTYLVTITDASGCTSTATAVLEPLVPLVVTGTGSLVHCSAADGTASVNVSGGKPPYAYFWNSQPVQTTETATGLGAGMYTCTVTDLNNCSATVNVELNGSTMPVASFTYTPEEVSLKNPYCSFTDGSLYAAEWLWDFDDPLNPGSSNLRNPTHTFKDTGRYCVRLVVKNIDGCADTAVHCIYVNTEFSLFVPTAFSPNNDGINDRFCPKIFGTEGKDYLFEIYNRWGEILFSTKSPDQSWDGKIHKTQNIPRSDVYLWKLRLIDNSINDTRYYRGQVTVVR